MENFLAVFMVVLLILSVIQIIALVFAVYKLQIIAKTVEDNFKDTADALSKTVNLMIVEFNNNFESLKKMQEWNEKAVDANVENISKLANSQSSTQVFLGKMAEGLGLSFRSNLEDV